MDIVTLALSKKFTKETASEFGGLKGAPCTIEKTFQDADGNTIVVFSWQNSKGEVQTTNAKIIKGVDGTNVIASVEKNHTVSTVKIKDVNGETSVQIYDGEKGERGHSLASAYFDNESRLVIVLDNGLELEPVALPSVKVDVSKEEGNIAVHKADGIYVSETDLSEYAKKIEIPQDYAKKDDLTAYVKKETDKQLIETKDINQIAVNKSSIGSMSALAVPSWTNLVNAVNSLYYSFMESLEYKTVFGENKEYHKVLQIKYKNGKFTNIELTPIITDTNLGELNNVYDVGVKDGEYLCYDNSRKMYVPKPLDLQAAIQEANKYTDEQIAEHSKNIAISCDEKPVYEDGVITYIEDGVTKTTTDTSAWFYYKDEEGLAHQTKWIDGVEYTIELGNIDLSGYVKKSSVTSTYTGNDTEDKSKIPNIAALDVLFNLIQTRLSKKINSEDIEDNLNSDSSTKVLSAKQGKVLSELLANKIDKGGKIDKAEVAEVANSVQWDNVSGKPTNYIVAGSQTQSSSEDNGENIFTFSKADGTTATFITKNGSKGSDGEPGTSAVWFYGNDVTGVELTPTFFGVLGSKAGDMYLNSTTYNVYSASGENLWSYVCNLKGAKGSDGVTPTFEIGNVVTVPPSSTAKVSNSGEGSDIRLNFEIPQGKSGDTGVRGSRWNTGTVITGTSIEPTVFELTEIEDSLVNDMYLNTSTGYVYRCTKDGDASTAEWIYEGVIKGPKGENSTTTNVVNPAADGLAPRVTDTSKFLKGDGTWSDTPYPEIFTGATDEDNGTAGLVPAPIMTKTDKYLKSNGNWEDIHHSKAAEYLSGVVNGDCITPAHIETKVVNLGVTLQYMPVELDVAFTYGNSYGDIYADEVVFPKLELQDADGNVLGTFPICDSRGRTVGKGAWNDGDIMVFRLTRGKALIMNSDVRQQDMTEDKWTTYADGKTTYEGTYYVAD